MVYIETKICDLLIIYLLLKKLFTNRANSELIETNFNDYKRCKLIENPINKKRKTHL